MGLAVRIIPSLLMRGSTLVKGQRFQSWRTVGHVEQAMRIYQRRSVDEVILLDIEATPQGRGPDFEQVKQLTHGFFTPVTVGGGVRTVKDIAQLLHSGADKVCIGAAAHDFLGRGETVVSKAAEHFGSQAIVVAIDVSGAKVISRGEETIWKPRGFARIMEEQGAGEILLTSIDREGSLSGYDLELVRSVSEAVSIPVIAHGGCGSYQDMLQAIKAGASAVAAGSLFQFTDCTPAGAAQWLSEQGIETRVPA